MTGTILGSVTGALNPYLFWIKLAGIVIVLAATAGATHYVDANVYGNQIKDLKLAAAQQQTASVTASLNQLQGFIASMHTSDANYNSALNSISAQFDTIKKEFANATRAPLPADCKPDAGRLRVLQDAVAATGVHPAASK